MGEIILKAKELGKVYKIGNRRIDVLKGINMSVEKGEFVVIAGSSGSGKSTLLSVLSGIDLPDNGCVYIAGKEITQLTEDQLAPVRNNLTGFVFQAFHLIPSLNSLENVMFPAELRNDPDSRAKAEGLLERVGLKDRMLNFPEQLSGGEQQRVAICRALVNNPEIVFADEPTGNLDSENSDAIISLLLEMYKDRNTTLIVATHSMALASKADRIIRLYDGHIQEDGGRI